MPRETLKDSTGSQDWELQVGWTSDKDRLEASGGTIRFATVAPNMPLVTDDTTPENNGWHIYLNKDQITKLQSILRRAKKKIK